MSKQRGAFHNTPTGTKLQGLLDEGDLAWFARSHERERRRFYFRGERIDVDGAVSRHIIVTQEAGRLVRRFAGAGAMA